MENHAKAVTAVKTCIKHALNAKVNNMILS